MLPSKVTMIVLSLFDGISAGRIALERAGIPVEKYYASEIDKYAIDITKHNFPDIIHLGDVREINVFLLPKIDLLIGGSPCTNLSLAGKQGGLVSNTLDEYLKLKKNNFDFKNNQSYLFWEFLRILKEVKDINPDVLLFLENVMMKKEWKDLITNSIQEILYPSTQWEVIED